MDYYKFKNNNNSYEQKAIELLKSLIKIKSDFFQEEDWM
ncbi:MAG: hypothetical protein K0Q97_446 [Bacillota bacterium]|jgi:hypothetical protein|nr:hypothetical protein [Bacillota bacterium]